MITHYQQLYVICSDFNERYKDILEMDIPNGILDSFTHSGTVRSSNLDEELIELITNEKLKVKFNSRYQVLWLQKAIPILYKGLWDMVLKFLIVFPSMYLAEQGFLLLHI